MTYFNKYPYIANFEFAHSFSDHGWHFEDEHFQATLASNGAGVFRLHAPLQATYHDVSQVEFDFEVADEPGDAEDYTLSIADNGELALTDFEGHVLLKSTADKALGVCGSAHILSFRHEDQFRYYGMGEKLLGLEVGGVQTKFCNIDAFGDFDGESVMNGRVDPYYASIPYLIIRTPHGWVGLIMNNPFPTFMSTAAAASVEGFKAVEDGQDKRVIIGGEDGELDLFVLAAPSLSDLTRKFQCLVGTTPLPPLWALGFHQCRWGYKSIDDLMALRKRFEELETPVDGLWLDIDYMDGFRVFTMSEDALPNPKDNLAEVQEKGQHVVPIIDPGVKFEPGYSVYDEGHRADVFCKNPQGREFVGLVWPGETVFPDFSREDAQAWWAAHVQSFAEQGISGCWIDMNDPSTGSVDPTGMLFDQGALPHDAFHNQYAMGMARATREGFMQAHPNQRPFVISRSSFLGGGRYAAVWTGDNAANYTYLKKSIPTNLNLSLSGIPFTGGDVGGFAGDTPAHLLRDWTRAGFLTPFFRNHTATGTRQQEIWAYDEVTMEVCREYIRSRYTLLPYIYQLFVQQEESGDAVLRPLLYEFEDDDRLSRLQDAYLLGASILHAPVMEEGGISRDVLLPGSQPWYSVMQGAWVEAGLYEKVEVPEALTPLYFRADSIIPMRPGLPADQHTNLSEVDLHLFMTAGESVATCSYVADDGCSFEYRKGGCSRLEVTATAKGAQLKIHATLIEDGYGPITTRFIVHGDFEQMEVNGVAVDMAENSTRLAACDVPGLASPSMVLGPPGDK